jgi:restriction system protein
MKSYYRVMLGKGSVFAAECFAGGFIGADFDMDEDLSGALSDQWREFNKRFIPVFLTSHPGKPKVTAGLACGALLTIGKGINDGDIVLCPDGAGSYRVGEVTGGYYYASGGQLPHRRRVRWLDVAIAREPMSEALRNSTGSIGIVSKRLGSKNRSGTSADWVKVRCPAYEALLAERYENWEGR